jgi:hypothetical protein
MAINPPTSTAARIYSEALTEAQALMSGQTAYSDELHEQLRALELTAPAEETPEWNMLYEALFALSGSQ